MTAPVFDVIPSGCEESFPNLSPGYDSRNLKLNHYPALVGTLDFQVKGFLNSYSFTDGLIYGDL
jgi:hypothetical protein